MKAGTKPAVGIPTPPREEGSHESSPEEDTYMGDYSPHTRCNEDTSLVERQKVDDAPVSSRTTSREGTRIPKGPFLDDSDQEDWQRTSCTLHSDRIFDYTVFSRFNDATSRIKSAKTLFCREGENRKMHKRSTGPAINEYCFGNNHFGGSRIAFKIG